MNQFRQEWKVYEQNAGPVVETVPPNFSPPAYTGWRTNSAPVWTMTSNSSITRLNLALRDVLDTTTGYPRLSLYDDKGNGMGEQLGLMMPYVPPTTRKPDSDTRELRYDAESMLFQKTLAYGQNIGHDTIERDSEAGKQILEPEFEPLTLGSELYLQYARAKSVNLVSLLNDNSLRSITVPQPVMTVGTFENILQTIAVREESDGWLLTTPNQPVDARRGRDDRKRYRTMLLDAADGHLSLESACEYVASRPQGSPTGIGYRLAALFDSEIAPFSLPGSESAMRVYGLLSPKQRSGETMTWAWVPKSIAAELRSAIYNDGRFTNKARQYREGETQKEPEITDDLPDGPPLESLFMVSRSELPTEIQQSMSDMSAHFGGDSSPWMIASFIFFRDNPQLIEGSTQPYVGPDRFQVCDSSGVTMKLDMGSFETTLFLRDRKARTGRVPFEKLPDDIKKQIQLELDKMNAQKAAGNPPKMIRHSGNGGGGKPPPRSSLARS